MVVRQNAHPSTPTPDPGSTVSASATSAPMVHFHALDEKDSKA
jgi:hypothetical protein